MAIATTTMLLMSGDNPKMEEKEVSKLPKEAIEMFIKVVGNRISFTHGDRDSHGKDYSYHAPENPDAVIYPINEAEIVKIVNICHQYEIPIIPFGSGTSLEGHILAPHGGVSIDFKLMQKVLEIRVDDLDVTVQPGISYDDLNEALRPHGYFFAMDPGPGASLGGMVGTSCSGTHAVRYGTMKENVLSLRVVTPDGRTIKTRSRARKSSAGYDLTHLFIGAEGTLGLVTELTVRIHPLPESTAVSLVTFNSISDATRTVIQTMQAGVQIGRAELMDDLMMKAVNMSNDTSYDEAPTLIFEFTGSPSAISEQIAKVQAISVNNSSKLFKFATTDEEREKLWFARKVALWSSTVLRPNSEVLITDVCVPLSRLSDIVVETKKDMEHSCIIAPLVSHAGDGNFHLFVLFDPKNEAESKEAKRISNNLVHRAIEMDGTCTGEHGVAMGKKQYLEKELGVEAIDLMRLLKKTIDPKNIMNPGKVV
eukprot:gene6771-7870_t